MPNNQLVSRALDMISNHIWKSSVLSHWGWLKGKPKRL